MAQGFLCCETNDCTRFIITSPFPYNHRDKEHGVIGMSSIWVIGTIYTAVGFGVGGILAWVVKGFPKHTDTVYCLCTGMILGLLSLEVAPEALEMGNWLTFISGFLIGVFLFNLLHRFSHLLGRRSKKDEKHVAIYTGMMLLIGVSIHNLPIGLSLGAVQEASLTRSLLQTIFLHNIPEGLIVFTPFIIANIRKWTLLMLSLLVSLPVGVGAYLGSKYGVDYPLFWSMFLSLSIGMIYMVTVKEILTDSIQDSSSMRVFLLTLLGFCFIGLYFAFI